MHPAAARRTRVVGGNRCTWGHSAHRFGRPTRDIHCYQDSDLHDYRNGDRDSLTAVTHGKPDADNAGRHGGAGKGERTPAVLR